MNTICKEAGGTMVNSFDFLYRGDYLSLGWVGDVMPLTKMYGELSNHMMDWIRAWLNPQIEDTKSYVCSPYLVSLLRSHVRDKNSSVEVYVDFLHDKCTSKVGRKNTDSALYMWKTLECICARGSGFFSF